MTNHWHDGGAWEAAADPETGRLERPVSEVGWPIPVAVELDVHADRLIISRESGRQKARAAPGLLEQFHKLADAPPTKIRDYARRWGVLELCAHGLPMSHNKPQSDRDGGKQMWFGCVPLPVDETFDVLWEPIAVWRRFARNARGMLSVAVRLRDGEAGPPESWRAIDNARLTAAVLHTVTNGEDLPFGGSTTEWRALAERAALGRDVAFDQEVLGLVMNDWLRLGDVRPSSGWQNGVPRVVHGGDGLFGALAVQLLLVIRGGGLAACSSCGGFYTPKRRPAIDRRRYCEECGRRAAVRDAQREKRQKLRNRARPHK